MVVSRNSSVIDLATSSQDRGDTIPCKHCFDAYIVYIYERLRKTFSHLTLFDEISDIVVRSPLFVLSPHTFCLSALSSLCLPLSPCHYLYLYFSLFNCHVSARPCISSLLLFISFCLFLKIGIQGIRRHWIRGVFPLNNGLVLKINILLKIFDHRTNQRSNVIFWSR